MDPSFWHRRWERNEIGFHQDQINTHLQRYWPTLGLSGSEQVFVPLCGKSRDMVWLRSLGHRVLGVELSPVAVKQFFEENELPAKVTRERSFNRWESDGLVVLCGDFLALNHHDLKDSRAVYDRASLIALPPQTRSRYVNHLVTLLRPDTPGLLVTMEYLQTQMDGPPFSVPQQEVLALLEDSFKVDCLHSEDILSENPRFTAKGLTQLVEKIYRFRYQPRSRNPSQPPPR